MIAVPRFQTSVRAVQTERRQMEAELQAAHVPMDRHRALMDAQKLAIEAKVSRA